MEPNGFARLHRRVDNAFRVIENVSVAFAGALTLTVMILVFFDAILRRLFSSPLTFQLPLSENYLLVALVLMSLAWGYREGGSIRVQLLLGRLPGPLAVIVLRAGLAVSAIYMMFLAIFAFPTFYVAWVEDEVIMGIIDWPVAWSWIWIPIGCAMLSIRLAIDSVRPADGPEDLQHTGEIAE